jgi:hypothetical protein
VAGVQPPSEVNPYAPSAVVDPQAELAQAGVGVWRDGKLLVMHRDAVLPDICLKSGQPATRRFKQTLACRDRKPFSRAKTLTLQVPLSDRQFFLAGVGSWLLACGVVALYGMLGVTVALAAGRLDPPYAGYLIVAVLLVLGVVLTTGGFLREVVHVHRWRGDYLWLSGPGSRFLEQLPDWPLA